MDTTKLLSSEELAILPRIMAQLELDDNFINSLPQEYQGIVRSLFKNLPEAYNQLIHHYDATEKKRAK